MPPEKFRVSISSFASIYRECAAVAISGLMPRKVCGMQAEKVRLLKTQAAVNRQNLSGNELRRSREE